MFGCVLSEVHKLFPLLQMSRLPDCFAIPSVRKQDSFLSRDSLSPRTVLVGDRSFAGVDPELCPEGEVS